LVAAVTGLVADAVSAGLLVVNTEGRVVWVNAALAAIVGVGAERRVVRDDAGDGSPGAGGGAGGVPDDRSRERRDGPLDRASARRAVADARLPLSGLVPGAAPVDVRWTAPGGDARWLRLRCQALTVPGGGWGGGWGDGLTLYELFDVTAGYQATAALGGDETWKGTSDWDEAAWGPGADTATVAMVRPRSGTLPAPVSEGVIEPVLPSPGALPVVAAVDRLGRIEELTCTGTWEWNLATGVITCSRNLLVLFGFDPAEKPDLRQIEGLLPPLDNRTIRTKIGKAIAAPGTFTYIHRILGRDGRGERVFECHGDVITDGTGRAARVMGTARDITDLHRVQQELAHLADQDALTGLFNRRAITNALREHLAASPPGRAGSLLIIDVDHFKDINDLRGHAVGDIVMRGLTQILRDELPAAVLGRLGGDEFAVLLPTGDGAAGLAVAERLCQAVARSPIPVDDLALRVTVSIGVVPLAVVEDDTAALAQADLALYDSKGAGRDRARLFSDEQYEQAARRVSVTQRVRAALEAGTLAVDALPLVDLAARRVIGYELLVRLRDGLTPQLSPREFLEPVERTELVLRLDRWVVSQAVAALASDGPHGTLYLHVNISARSVEDPGFGDFVLDALHGADVHPARLGLEIAERSTLVSIEPARRLAEKLTTAGCRFILDDFGVGMGSVVHLRTLPFSGIKIDGEFVQQADVNAQDIALVDAVVRIARTLGMYTIAENVDRESLARALAEIGVDYAQGFHVGQPRPLAELLAERSGAGESSQDDRADAGRAVATHGELERAELERAELERAERERVELERAELERAERERVELERAELERAERERAELERAELERAERERVELERAELERAERERAEQERVRRERAERERAERERVEPESAARLERERERAERVRRDQLEAERRRAENRGSVSWERPGLGDLAPGTAPPPPGSPPPTYPGTPYPGSSYPGTPYPGSSYPGTTPPSGGAADGVEGAPTWSYGPATGPSTPSFPPFPAVSPPGDPIPDYPPTGGFALGGPPSGPVALGGQRGPGFPEPGRTGDGFPLGGFPASNRPDDAYQGGGYQSDAYQSGGYGGYGVSRRDPLGLDRIGYLGRDPLFGAWEPTSSDGDGAGGHAHGGSAGQPAGGATPGRPDGQDRPPSGWGRAGGAGPAPWDIVSVGGVVAAGPGPGAETGTGGFQTGLEIGGVDEVGHGSVGVTGGRKAPDADRDTGPGGVDGGDEQPAWLGRQQAGPAGWERPGGVLRGDFHGDFHDVRDMGASADARDHEETGPGSRAAAGDEAPGGEAGDSPAARGGRRRADARDEDGPAGRRRAGGLQWVRRHTLDPRSGTAGAGTSGPRDADPAGDPPTDASPVLPIAGDAEDGGGSPPAPTRDSAETQVVTINNNGHPTGGTAGGGLYRWP